MKPNKKIKSKFKKERNLQGFEISKRKEYCLASQTPIEFAWEELIKVCSARFHMQKTVILTGVCQFDFDILMDTNKLVLAKNILVRPDYQSPSSFKKIIHSIIKLIIEYNLNELLIISINIVKIIFFNKYFSKNQYF